MFKVDRARTSTSLEVHHSPRLPLPVRRTSSITITKRATCAQTANNKRRRVVSPVNSSSSDEESEGNNADMESYDEEPTLLLSEEDNRSEVEERVPDDGEERVPDDLLNILKLNFCSISIFFVV